MMRHFLMRCCLILVAACCCSCHAPPRAAFDDSISLPAPKPSNDSIVFEVASIIVPPDAGVSDAIWSELDEQIVAPGFRRALAANGVRCGMVGSRYPDGLRGLLDHNFDQPSDTTNGLMEIADGMLENENRTIQIRNAGTAQVVTSLQDPLIVLYNDHGSLSGTTYANAQTLFELVGHHGNDGSVDLTLTPEIHHGQAKNRFVGREGAFRLEATRQIKRFEDLRIQVNLTPGKTLVLTATEDDKSVGSGFFGLADHRSEDGQKLLLIRLTQAPPPTLFADTAAKTNN